MQQYQAIVIVCLTLSFSYAIFDIVRQGLKDIEGNHPIFVLMVLLHSMWFLIMLVALDEGGFWK